MNTKEAAMSLTNAGFNPGSDRAAGDPSSRKLHLIVLSVGLLWLLFWYRDTFMAMVSIWDRSETFAHGFVIAPISAWLIWRRRHFIRNLPIEPSLFGVVAGLGAGFAWLLGELASVDAVSQFAFIGMLVSFIWAVMGTAVVRTYAFPIGFLFFMVPFGEFMFPSMMDWTANFIIWAVRASGVPVYAEGYNLVIPSGRWQVVEGCSGVRYLMASVVVGSLYAYLNYRSTQKRLIFVAASIIVPIFANWLRAYGIVMLGHISNNKLAAGADHLVYGWVFFGIIIMILFWIGSRWQEAEEQAPAAPVTAAGALAKAKPSTGARMGWVAAAVVAVGLWVPLLGYLDRQGEHGVVQIGELAGAGKWVPVANQPPPQWKPRYQGMRAQSHAVFSGEGTQVGVFITYYRDQQAGEELINSENRILLNKDEEFRFTASGRERRALGGETVGVRTNELRSNANAEQRLIVWHWYWIGGRWTDSDYVGKAYLALAQLLGRGDDSAMVALYTPVTADSKDTAQAALADFLATMGPQIGTALEHARVR
jgi:exosortase A